jgi:hypothetical protein
VIRLFVEPNRSGECVARAHAPLASASISRTAYMEYLQPFGDAMRFLSYGNVYGGPAVVLLRGRIRPAAIVWRVGAVGVDAIHRVFGSGAWANIACKGQQVVLPTLTNIDAKRPVEPVGRVFKIIAAANHAAPYLIKRVAAQSRGDGAFSTVTPARLAQSIAEIGGINNRDGSAFANTRSHRPCLMVMRRLNAALFQNGPSPEALPNKIDFVHVPSRHNIAYISYVRNGGIQ